ncbi:MAG: C1 family peptidase [Bacteroidota bacterium]
MHKNIIFTLVAICCTISVTAQEHELKYKTYEPGFYHQFILKDVKKVQEEIEKEASKTRLVMDQSDVKLPDEPSAYTKIWAQPTLSQGNAGTCWAYGGTSFFESEHKRLGGDAVKLSEIYTVYWEYVEKARRYVEKRGESRFTQGSQANAVTRMIKLHGAMPESAYSGLKRGRKYHSHEAMMKEMKNYLNHVKSSASWNEEKVIATIKSIMHHHIGRPPAEFEYKNKEYTPETFRDEYLKFNVDEYVDVISTLAFPYHEQAIYKVPDNWWKCDTYQNLPLDEYMELLNTALKNGYSVAIGGDVSEAGFSRNTNAAIIPDFDIASENINANAREFRFDNSSTSDDHIMHITGYQKFKGDMWYLVKDSSSGSRNVGEDSNKFGYYFMHEDYIRLKILTITVHKDMFDSVKA